MKKLALIGFALATLTATSAVKYNPSDVGLSSVEAERQGNIVRLAFNIDAQKLRLKSNQEVTVLPFLAAGRDTLRLDTITVAGRNRYYFHLRNDRAMVPGIDLFHNGKDAAAIPVRADVGYRPWMDLSKVGYELRFGGCCNAPTGQVVDIPPVALLDMRPAAFQKELVFVAPTDSGAKVRSEHGSALIDFIVNKTDINVGYHNNANELGKIQDTINQIRGDKDLTITKVTIKGFASPEGPYDNNVRLAKGRTEALMKHVRQLYPFPTSVRFETAYEPEDWEGFEKAIVASNIANKDGILAIIRDKALAPDARDARIRTTYPAEYEWIKNQIYPFLRHSDYEIFFTVRDYKDVDEILKVMRENPRKLSQTEFYRAANSFRPGSDQYNEIFDIAVLMFPDDAIANINAANSALSRGDVIGAERYLQKAGNGPYAEYARGISDAMVKDYDAAIAHFERAKDAIPEAAGALESVRALAARPEGSVSVTPLP